MKKSLRLLLLPFFIVVFLSYLVLANTLSVQLLSPEDKANLTSSEVTFTCNATDDKRIDSIIIYTNQTGSFSPLKQKVFGESDKDENTILLCHFNNIYTCEDGEMAIHENTSFEKSLLFYGVSLEGPSLLRFNSSSNINLIKGTIEFWVKIKSFSDFIPLFALDDGSECGINELEARVYWWPGYRRLEFVIYDKNVEEMFIIKDISSWSENEWHYIALGWDTAQNPPYIQLTVDNETVSCTQEYIDLGLCSVSDFTGFLPNYIPEYISLGHLSSFENYYLNGTIDELKISNVLRDEEELNASYYKALDDYSDVTFTWNATLPDGSYKWNCLAINNESEEVWAVENYTFSIDTRPPTFHKIGIRPETLAELDPGVVANVTANISDMFEIDTVVLQWKKSGDWNDVVMNYNSTSKLYEASFPTDPFVPGIYFYRIWANDSFGNEGYSQVLNITVDWDFTWETEPIEFFVSGPVDSFATYIISINNTGDDTLQFTLTHKWIREVYFNGSLSYFSFYLDKGKSASINVTFRLLEYPSELNTNITINALHSYYQPQPANISLEATVNSYVGGPYLTVSIVEYPSIIKHSSQANISAMIKNIGNETATAVTIQWLLPSGWSNVSGNLFKEIGDMPPGAVKTANITVFLDPAQASAGTSLIAINATCDELVYGFDQKLVGVECSNEDLICGLGCTYATDKDCSVPYVEVPQIIEGVTGVKAFPLLLAPSILEVKRGSNATVVIKLVNPSSRKLENISLILSGTALSFTKVLVGIPPSLPGNSSAESILFVEPPNYISRKKYQLILTFKGLLDFLSVNSTVTIIIDVHDVSFEEAVECINQSSADIISLEKYSLNTRMLASMLAEANKKLEDKMYEDVKSLCDTIKRNVEYAFKASTTLREMEEKINKSEENGIKAILTKNVLTMSKAALLRGDFATAIKRLEDAQNIFYLETAGKFNLLKLALDNWVFIAVAAVSLCGIAYFIKARLEISQAAQKLKSLRNEELSILESMEKIKEKTFKENAMSLQEYYKAMYEYQKMLSNVRNKMARIKRKCKRNFKALEKEKLELEKMIKNLQNDYFIRGKMSKSVYEEKMNVFVEELADLTIELEMAKGREI